MPSLIPGYEYDIFISYRQKDNKGDHWVTKFVRALKTELESTFKEDISIYFDENSHDGLRETHDVDESLAKKLKCLIFIPILSQTYCDPKSFAWQHEFLAFVKMTTGDGHGLKIRLGNGNVASRILPVRIHDLDAEDKALFETEVGGVLRPVDFIFKSPGVVRPLRSHEDRPQDNLNKTYYRDQINKAAHGIKELVSAIKEPSKNQGSAKPVGVPHKPVSRFRTWRKALLIVAGLVMAYFAFFNKPNRFGGGNLKTDSPDKSIAVLPFADMSPNHDQEYFSDGLSEALITLLSNVPQMKVIARTSAFSFKGRNEDVRTIGEMLGVAHLLEGSVQKSGNKLRITATLVKVSDGSHLWSETYTRDEGEFFKIQDEIAAAVVSKLKVAMLGPLKTSATPVNSEAFNLFLQGKYLVARLEPGFMEKAMEKYQQSLAIDPNDARVWAALSAIYTVKAALAAGKDSYNETVGKAKEAAERAIALNDQVAEGHSALAGIMSGLEYDWKSAEAEFKKAMSLNPEENGISGLYMALGRLDEAVAIRRKVVESDPVNVRAWWELSVSLSHANKLDDALAASQKALEISPQYLFGHYTAGNVYLLQGKFSEAFAEYHQDPIRELKLCGLTEAYFAAGKKAKSDSVLNQLIVKLPTGSLYFAARACAYRGEADRAFAYLDQALTLRAPGLPVIKTDPFMKKLKGDPRFGAVLKRMNLPVE